jgi:DNA-binding transcriptional regulator YiaG
MAKRFTELKERLDKKAATDPEVRRLREQARLDARREHIEWTLTEVRQTRNITQVELAGLLATAQSNVSRIEHGEDLLLSTLRSYIEALGGRLEITAIFDADERVVLDVA